MGPVLFNMHFYTVFIVVVSEYLAGDLGHDYCLSYVAQLLPQGRSELDGALFSGGEMERSCQEIPVLLYQKPAMHVDAGDEVHLESGTYAIKLLHRFGHCKKLHNDAKCTQTASKKV